jgi:hypothetical protein
MPAHRNLTGANLHEPKGIAAATAGKVYISDGAGSGVWTLLDIPEGTFRVTKTEFTTSGTWTKPADLFLIRVTVIGGGANSTVSVAGTNGGTSSFGAHCSATGGTSALAGSTGTAGTGSNGDVNLTGGVGGFQNTSASCWLPGGLSNSPFPLKGKGADLMTNAENGTAGCGGGAAIKYIVEASLASTVAVTISSAAQANGYVLVEEFILV